MLPGIYLFSQKASRIWIAKITSVVAANIADIKPMTMSLVREERVNQPG